MVSIPFPYELILELFLLVLYSDFAIFIYFLKIIIIYYCLVILSWSPLSGLNSVVDENIHH